LSSSIKDYENNSERKLELPQADVLRFTFEEGFIALRPSGTEPKIKVYFSLNADQFDEIVAAFQTQFLS
ncbi:phosphoglucomutase, partial [Staphylococcus felis]